MDEDGRHADQLGLIVEAANSSNLPANAGIRSKVNAGLKQYILGKRIYRGWFADWYFTADRAFGGEPLLAWKAPAPKRNDPIGDSLSGRVRTAPGPRRAVGHASTAFCLVALDPSLHDLRSHRVLRGCLGLGKVAFHNRKRHLLSTQGRETGILMDVHSDPPTNLKRGNSSLLGQVRMDNLLKAHI